MSTTTIQCGRCGGTGLIPQYGHIAHGVCFQCKGAGTRTVKARPDGTVDHDHQLPGIYWRAMTPDESKCVHCGLPADEWPPVVAAVLHANGYAVHLSAQQTIYGVGEGLATRQARAAVRALVLDAVPSARIKWRAS